MTPPPSQKRSRKPHLDTPTRARFFQAIEQRGDKTKRDIYREFNIPHATAYRLLQQRNKYGKLADRRSKLREYKKEHGGIGSGRSRKDSKTKTPQVHNAPQTIPGRKVEHQAALPRIPHVSHLQSRPLDRSPTLLSTLSQTPITNSTKPSNRLPPNPPTMSSSNPNFPPAPYEAGTHIAPPPRPPSPATAGYSLNHFMMRIKDPQKTLRFYCDCLGMHVVFIFNAGPWVIYYLGGRDVNMQNIRQKQGLLELYHIPADTSTPYVSGNDYSAPGVGFGHIGFTVPDVDAATKRVQEFGFEVLKPLDQAREDQMAVPDEVVQGKWGDVAEGYKHVFRQLTFVKDPDGYWVELIPPKFKALGEE